MYPAVFIMLALVLDRTSKKGRFVGMGWCVLVIAVNGWYMFLPRVAAKREGIIAPVERIISQASRPQLFVTLNVQDDLFEFKRNYPFHPLTRDTNFLTYPLLLHPRDQPRVWTATFAERVEDIWQQGGEVWLQKYLLEPRPRPEVYWAEGSHQTIHWRDISDSLSRLQTVQFNLSEEVVSIERSQANVELLRNWIGSTSWQ
jgi:hypothetical protein